jgi:hypothetical protein
LNEGGTRASERARADPRQRAYERESVSSSTADQNRGSSSSG